MSTPGVVLDAGAFVALERRDAFTAKLFAELTRRRAALVTSGAVVARVWRGGSRQAVAAMLLARVEILPLDETAGRIVGLLLGARGGRDVVDGHVALIASERRYAVITSDPDDLARLDPRLVLIRV